MKESINEIFEKHHWFEHKDCTEENCVLTFIKNNYDKFDCEHSKSCDYSWMISEIKNLRLAVDKLNNLFEDELTLLRYAIIGFIKEKR